jgi:hypothetical protein
MVPLPAGRRPRQAGGARRRGPRRSGPSSPEGVAPRGSGLNPPS